MWSFTFKGESSRDFGITVNRRAPRQSANVRTLLTEIDGRDGAFIEKVGYNTYTMNMEITVQGQDNLHKITSWLKGEGKFTRSDVPERCLLVKHESEIEFIMISKELYSAQLTFQVMYPKWLKEDNWSEAWGANLIPNGWDSFRPHGSGENFATNWDFSDDNLTTWAGSYGNHSIENGVYVKKITEEHSAARIETWNRLGSGEYVWVLKIRGNSRVAFRNHGNASSQEVITDLDAKEYTVVKIPFTVNVPDKETVTLRGYMRSTPVVGRQVEIDWNYISKIDNQHLVVEKTPLDSGLTRIQTWGGNNEAKLQSSFLPRDFIKTISMYVKTDKYFRIWDRWTTEGNLTKPNGVEGHVTVPVGMAAPYSYIQAKGKDGNLDFIASTPTIVEGNTPPIWEADENPRIINEGNTTSQPIIRLIKGKEDKLDIVINGIRFIYQFDNSPYVDIDCYTQEVIDSSGLNKSRYLKIGYLFPELKPGDNVVEIKEGDATVLFRRKDAWK